MKNIDIKLFCPIYDTIIWLVVGDADEKRKRLEASHGPCKTPKIYACCSWPYNNADPEFALMFCHDAFKHASVRAHEVFHMTHRIMQSADVRFDIDNHEAFAHLHGWIAGKIERIWMVWSDGEKREPLAVPPQSISAEP